MMREAGQKDTSCLYPFCAAGHAGHPRPGCRRRAPGARQLRTGFRPGDDVGRLLRHRARDLAALRLDQRLRFVALKLGSVPVSTKVWPASAPAAAGAGSPSGQCTPAARNCSITSRLCGSPKNSTIERATIGPTSCTCCSASAVAAISASRLPKCRARSRAVASPTLRMPSAKMKRASVVERLFSIAASRFCADFAHALEAGERQHPAGTGRPAS